MIPKLCQIKGNLEKDYPHAFRLLWCNVHQRLAYRCKNEGGIMIPCRVVDLTDELEFIDDA